MSASDTLEVYFHQGSSRWDPKYYDNAKHLEEFVNRFKEQTESAEMRRITKIHIVAACSPEGLWEFNQRLSKNRAKSIRKVLADYITLPDSIVVERPIGVNWPGLEAMVVNDPNVPYREEVLDIIRNTPELYTKKDGKTLELRKLRLAWRFDGKAWEYMYENFFPTLRSFNLQIVVEWEKFIQAPPQLQSIVPVEKNQVTPEKVQGIKPAPPTGPQRPSRKTILAAKTNLLYDAGTAVNFALEIPFNEKFSILYEHHCPWWLSKNNKYCLQFLSFGGEFRWWFAPRDILVGHFVGVYGWTGYSDIQAGNKIGCYQFEFCSAGLTYGYSMPISKYLNLEFSISAGYAQIPYQHYIPTEDWQILIRDHNNAGTLHYIGPTKAEISLVIPIRAKIKGGAK